MFRTTVWRLTLSAAIMAFVTLSAEASSDKKVEDGKYVTEDGNPSYNVGADGNVDWYTYSGFRRYHSDCHVCHGPEGLGSSYAPALVDSLKKLSYEEFATVVASGRQKVNAAQTSVMPAFGTNRNVMCYLDDIYAYLKARSDGALGRGRPRKHDKQPPTNKEYEKDCMGM